MALAGKLTEVDAVSGRDNWWELQSSWLGEGSLTEDDILDGKKIQLGGVDGCRMLDMAAFICCTQGLVFRPQWCVAPQLVSRPAASPPSESVRLADNTVSTTNRRSGLMAGDCKQLTLL